MFIPQRRGYSVSLNFDAVSNWNRSGKLVTHFMNALSAYFPPGERFFLDSVRNYRKEAKGIPELEKAILGFIGQEVDHGRMHEQYDDALQKGGYPAKKLEKIVEKALKFVQKNTSKKFQLALTVAAEHYTALMANYLLQSDILFGADKTYENLWLMHAIEEIEHRNVSFDVYRNIHGDYATKMLAYAIVSAILFPVFIGTTYIYALNDDSLDLTSADEHIKLLRVLKEMGLTMHAELIRFLNPAYHPETMHITKNFELAKKEVFGDD